MDRLEKLCIEKGMRMTDQRRVIARVLSSATTTRTSRSCTVAPPPWTRTSRSPRSIGRSACSRRAGIIERHDFRDGRSRYEETPDHHHDHLIDMKTGKVVEFVDEEIEALQNAIARKLGYKLVDHRLELYGVPIEE